MKLRFLLPLLVVTAVAAQTINPNQVRPSAENGDVLTTVAGQTVWAPDTGGANGLIPEVVAPVPGQYVVLYPTSKTDITTPSSCANSLTNDLTSEVVVYNAGGLGGCGNWGTQWGGFTLPSYVSPSNVTAIYGFSISSVLNATAAMFSGCGTGGGGLSPSGTGGYPLQQVSSLTTNVGADIATMTCHIYWNRSVPVPSGDTSTNIVDSVGLIVYYTGSAPPSNSKIQIVPPLTYNPAALTLGIDPSVIGVLQTTTVGKLPVAGNFNGATISVSDGTSATDCTTGGGTNYVQCYSNGTTWASWASSGSGTVSGQANNVIPLATGSTTIGAQSHINENTPGTTTVTQPVTITGSVHGVRIAAGTAASGAAGSVVYASDATNGYGEINENNTGLSRICTAGNGVCAPGTGTVTSVSFTGGLISVANPTTTAALTVAGNSGGVPYFSSASTWASSAVLPSGDFMLGGGSGSAPTASFSVIPVANGGTGTGSALTGLVRGNSSAMTAAEISGDCTTSGSNAITCTKTNGTAFTGYATATYVANTTITVGSGVAFSANTCSSYTGTGGTASTTTMTGVTTGMTFMHTPTTDVHAVTGWSPASGGSLYFTSWPTANTLNDYVCNPSGATITTGASTTWNVSAR